MTRKGSTASSPRHQTLVCTRGSYGASGSGGPGAGADAPRRGLAAARRQLGMTLVEVIVAATLALIGFLVALVLYQAARNLFKKGEQATDQQQEVRVAYDMMLKDLRLAGYNWNASGEDRPGEEQIEGAWEGAVTVRGDFDFEDATKSLDPENVIAGSTNKATVGNDEIVTYCLRPATGTEGTNAVINADVTSSTTATSGGVTVAVRDGAREDVTIAGVATGTAQNNPPYNLYRVTLNNDNSTYGSANFQTWTLLAQNIKSLQFSYKDANNNTICGGTSGISCSTVLGGAEANKGARETIKKIDVTIVGMTALADKGFTDTGDTNTATKNFRKFSLTTEITPRNLGFKGRADVDTTPPSTPTGLALCPGHCGAMVAKWNANPSNQGVSLYTVKYGTSSATMNSVISTSGTSVFVSGLTEDTTYFFAVRATDAGGNSSSYTSSASSMVGDVSPTVTTPSAPGSFAAAGLSSPGGAVNLSWNTTATNTVNLACDPLTVVRDLAGYRLYRSTNSVYTPNDATNLVISETVGNPAGQTAVLNAQSVTYVDNNVVNCRDYYYNIKATDTTSCSNVSTALGTPLNGKAVSTIPPAAPTGVTAGRTSPSQAVVTWTAVNKDTSSPTPQNIYVDTYKIYRAQLNVGDDPESANYGSPIGLSTPPSVSYSDNAAPAEQGGKRLYYKISAVDDCPNESALSSSAQMNCNFNGSVGVNVLDNATGTSVSTSSMDPAPKRVIVNVTGTDVYTSANLVVVKSGGFQDEDNTITSGSPWTFVWTPNQGAGTYTATITVTNSSGCVATVGPLVWTVVINSCNTCATINANDPDPSTGTDKYYRQENLVPNSCSYDLVITSAAIRARSICTSGCAAPPMKLLKLQYVPSCNGGANVNQSCSVAADCPGATCSTTFANETSNVVYTAAGTGDNVSTTQTATVNFSAPYLTLKGNSSNTRFRWIFSTATPVWFGTNSNKKSVLEEDICFQQASSLCSPSCITNIRLEP